jgi:hypothetical protein
MYMLIRLPTDTKQKQGVWFMRFYSAQLWMLLAASLLPLFKLIGALRPSILCGDATACRFWQKT